MNRKDLADYFNSNISVIRDDKSVVMKDKFNPKDFVDRGISEEDINKLKESFDAFDIDKSGYISAAKLRAAFKTYANLRADSSTMQYLITYFDQSEMAELNFQDFVFIANPKTKQKMTG